jgi:hypothetical protein
MKVAGFLGDRRWAGSSALEQIRQRKPRTLQPLPAMGRSALELIAVGFDCDFHGGKFGGKLRLD